jgi:ribosome maturation factor RimP
MIEKEFVSELVTKALEGSSLFITSVSVKPGNKILVFLDGDHGVSIDDCVRVSRFVESSLNRDIEDYELNVSSHGLSSPLMIPRQYVKNIGKQLSVLMSDGKKLNGELIEVTDEHFSIRLTTKKGKKVEQEKNETIQLQYSEIKESKINISF